MTVGKLGKTRGFKGEIWVTPATDFPERFVGLKSIFVRNRSEWEKMKINHSVLIGGRPVLKFAGINAKEDVARLTNRALAVPGDQLVDLPEDSFYLFELVGCQVFDEETGDLLGEVIEVQQYPANDIYLVKVEDGKILTVPAVKDFVVSVDVEASKVLVRAELLSEPE